MKIHHDLPAEEVQIQIIPLIDVIFCILTFFILAALQLTRQQGIGVDLPQARTGSSQMRDMMVVTVNPTGLIYLDRNPQPVDRNQLYQSLRDYQQKNPSGLLVLNASKMAFYNDVVQILDLMRSVGGERVALATVPAESLPAPGSSPSPTISPTLSPYNLGAPTPGQSFNPNQLQIPTAPTGQPLPADGVNPALPGSSTLDPNSVITPSPNP